MAQESIHNEHGFEVDAAVSGGLRKEKPVRGISGMCETNLPMQRQRRNYVLEQVAWWIMHEDMRKRNHPC